jgi:hypothetical protein
MSTNLKGYTAAELATHAILLAAQQAPGQNLSQGAGSGAGLAAFKNQVGQRLYKAQQDSYASGGLTTGAIDQDGA